MIWIEGRPYDYPLTGEPIGSDWLTNSDRLGIAFPVDPPMVGRSVMCPKFWLKPVRVPGATGDKK